jgi:flagellar biosynthetic protein FliR
MFVGGVLIALPAVTALLIVNLAFGVMSRSAPQLNVFSLGFPFSIVFGAVIMWVALQGWLPQFDRMFDEFVSIASGWML